MISIVSLYGVVGKTGAYSKRGTYPCSKILFFNFQRLLESQESYRCLSLTFFTKRLYQPKFDCLLDISPPHTKTVFAASQYARFPKEITYENHLIIWTPFCDNIMVSQKLTLYSSSLRSERTYVDCDYMSGNECLATVMLPVLKQWKF